MICKKGNILKTFLRKVYNMDSKHFTNELHQIISMLTFNSWNVHESNTYSCITYVFINSYHDNWDNAKELYDYSIDFVHLNSIKDGCGGNCNDVCDYLNKIDKLCHWTPQILDTVAVDASHIEEVAPRVEEELSSTLLILTYFQVEPELISDESKSLRVFDNTLLGLVLKSILFCVLYKVNVNYINLYKFY
ncbi:variable surface protein [Plasmodium gonderi]|uniref:Variable surface protein n=1 Tax=Plasmodium gonderi TaxID=77519 RepID=A0A1Y1JSF3_PLAGO|nr:variable surface protein [Plasmodium gonderi]GAW84378.1 variable surface protein [Plasmodium gonderi]